MINVNQTIQRVEKKYVVTSMQYQELRRRMLLYMEEDEFPSSAIYNLYLDTKDFRLITNSLEKPIYKEKLRIRSYGERRIGDSQDVFLEIKKKYKDTVCKRRISIEYNELNLFLDCHGRYRNGQIEKELSYALRFYDVKPLIFLAYNRLSFRGKEDSTLRITFDFHIRSRFRDLCLSDRVEDKELLEEGDSIMEIKAMYTCPLWLVTILSDMKLYPTSFSKVGMVYKKERLGVDLVCLRAS